MFAIALLISLAVPAAILAWYIRHRPIHQIALSHFWYFSLIWYAAFPLRAWLIEGGHVYPQVTLQGVDTGWAPSYDGDWYALTLAISVLFWLATYLGYVATRTPTPGRAPAALGAPVPRARIVVLVLAALGIGVMLYINPTTQILDSSNYQEARKGSGLIWTLPEIFILGVFAYMAMIMAINSPRISHADKAILAVGLILAIWFGAELFSRRLAASVLFGIIVLSIVRCHRLWPLGLAAVIGTVLASGIAELVRRIPKAFTDVPAGQSTLESVGSQIHYILIENNLQYLSTSFEGAEHVARYLDKASWPQLVSGIDYGMSWLFNLGLGLVPRAIWTEKPTIYGGLEQMHWLYPKMFRGDFAATAIPTSYIVDFSFAFGIPVGLFVAFYLGRFFRTCESALWSPSAPLVLRGLSLLTFVYMFNVVRSGTAMGNTLILFLGVCVFMFGVRHVFTGFSSLLVGVVAGGPSRSPQTSRESARVYFYPHAYLRDRQLDTIRHWSGGEAVNGALASGRGGAQVSREQALAPARPSWKSRLPLVNIKRRPKDAPDDAAVYVWGGLMATGPFITDIDNPYAFTAYNTWATKLYRPVIQAFLESPRCLQIRCLSHACLDGLRREFGEGVADKAVVAYPVIAPADLPRRERQADRCRFVFISTQFEIKGGEALIKAFGRVVEQVPGAELDMVTHLPDRFVQLAQQTPNLRIHNADVSRDAVATEFLAKADVLVHPTYFDSFAMVVLEALAHGLPVIATDVYAIGEMVEDGHNGLLLSPPLSIWSGTKPTELFSDIARVCKRARETDTAAFEDALAQAMITMAKDPDFRERAGQASTALLQDRFGGRA